MEPLFIQRIFPWIECLMMESLGEIVQALIMMGIWKSNYII